MSIPRIWMDVDTGADDALALMAACALEREGKLKLWNRWSSCKSR